MCLALAVCLVPFSSIASYAEELRGCSTAQPASQQAADCTLNEISRLIDKNRIDVEKRVRFRPIELKCGKAEKLLVKNIDGQIIITKVIIERNGSIEFMSFTAMHSEKSKKLIIASGSPDQIVTAGRSHTVEYIKTLMTALQDRICFAPETTKAKFMSLLRLNKASLEGAQ